MVIDAWSGAMLLNFVAMLALAGITFFFVQHSGSDRRLAMTFLALQLDLALWTQAGIGWYLTTDPDLSLFWLRLYYAAIAMFGPVWLAHSLATERRDHWQSFPRLALISAPSLVLFLSLLTNDSHKLFYTEIIYHGGQIALQANRGPLFWLLAAITAGDAIFGLGLELFSIRSHTGWQRQYRWLIVLTTTPIMAACLLYTVGLWRLPVDPTALMAIAPAGVCAFYLFHHWLADVVRIGLADAARQMGDAIVVMDAKGRIVEANPAFSKIVRVDREDLVGRTVREVIGDLRTLVANLDEVIALHTESGKASAEARGIDLILNVTPPRVYRLMMWPTLNRRGSVLGRVITLRDVTENRQTEERLQRAQRLEAVGRIAAQVAHDFNNLLGPMAAYPDLIKMNVPADSTAAAFCDQMTKSAERMAEINQDMLALSRRGNAIHKPTDVNDVVKQALSDMREKPDSLKLVVALAPDQATVSGSAAQLIRVITNLVSNAREAMDDSGHLTVTTEHVDLDRLTGRSSQIEAGSYVRITVADTGSGIPVEIQDKVFDAFFSTKETTKKQGSGLGLAIVQAIVEDHRGYVDLQSLPGSGTSISIYLPACKDAVEVEARSSTRGGSERLLVVDDDRMQRQVMADVLSRLGNRVETAASGEEAIAFLRDHAVDMLILDMIMPDGMDGTETYRQAISIRPGQKAIMLSGFAETEKVTEARALGAGAFVRKPVGTAELATAVRTQLDMVRADDISSASRSSPPSALSPQVSGRSADYSTDRADSEVLS